MGWFNHQLGSLLQNMFFNIHPGKLTWNLKMKPWKRRFLLETIIFRFHVSFRRGTLLSLSEDLAQMAENEDDEAAKQLGGCGWLQLLTTVCGVQKIYTFYCTG